MTARTTRPTAGEPRHAARDNIDHDAREFGLHITQGGWRLGLLVARNVVKAPGRVAPETLAPKTNATEFARRSHTSAARVLRYLEAWERAAEAGIVPPTSQLAPGQETLKLNGRAFVLDVDVLPAWRSFYNTPRTPAAPVQTRPAQPETARTAPSVSAREMGTVAGDTPQVPQPTVGDDHVNRAVRAAGLNFRTERERGYPTGEREFGSTTTDDAAQRQHDAFAADVRDTVRAIRSYIRRLGDLASAPELSDTDTTRAATAVQITGMARQLERIAETMADPTLGVVTDEALAELLNAEGA